MKKSILTEKQLHSIKEQRINFLLAVLIKDKEKSYTSRAELLNNYTYYLVGVADVLDVHLSDLLNELDESGKGLHHLRNLWLNNTAKELYRYCKEEQRNLRLEKEGI